MIKEFDFFHGVIFTEIIHSRREPLEFSIYPSRDNASYVIDEKVGIYVKYSTKRMSPWRFSFLKRHQDEILEMKNKFGEVYLLLVCNDDGIVCLSFDDLKLILDHDHKEIEWISAVRNPGEMYKISGSDGDLDFKIGQNEFPNKILSALENYKKTTQIFSWFGSKQG